MVMMVMVVMMMMVMMVVVVMMTMTIAMYASITVAQCMTRQWCNLCQHKSDAIHASILLTSRALSTRPATIPTAESGGPRLRDETARSLGGRGEMREGRIKGRGKMREKKGGGW